MRAEKSNRRGAENAAAQALPAAGRGEGEAQTAAPAGGGALQPTDGQNIL